MSDDTSDRTFDPTPKRIEQFRKEGQIPKSRDAGAALGLLFGVAAVIGFKDAIAEATRDVFVTSFANVGPGFQLSTVPLALRALAIAAAPLAIGAALGGIVAGLAQTKFQIETSLVGFKIERLNPLPNLGRLFSPKHGLRETTVALIKVALVGAVAVSVMRSELDTIMGTSGTYSMAGAAVLAGALSNLILKTAIAIGVLAAMDYALSWWDISKKMKMTLKEIKDEMRGEEGDPKVKGRMRARARALSKKRMMSDVQTASAVVVNPTHYAVAIRYEPGDPAPIVVAKGTDDVALAIRTEARKHRVPIVENRALARKLHAEIAIGKTIKTEHFAAVARVLAYVFKMGGARRPRSKRSAPKKRAVRPQVSAG